MTRVWLTALALTTFLAPAGERGLRLETEAEVRLEVRGRNQQSFPLWPPGTVRARWRVTPGASRSDLIDPVGVLPAGTFVLRRAGSRFARVVLPDHRFFRLDLGELGAPTVEVVIVGHDRRAFEYLGLTCSAVHATMVLGAPPGAHAQGWFPPELAVKAEIWTTDALDEQPELLHAFLETLGLPGFEDPRLAAQVKMPLKVVISLMGKLSGTLSMTVTSFAVEDVPASEFELPSGATEIPSPLSPGAIIGEAAWAR